MGFKLIGVAEAINENRRQIEREFIDFLLAFFQAVISGTPVDTGFHRGNWLIDFGRFVARTIGSRESPPPRPTGTQLNTWTFSSGNVFVHNSGPVIDLLDSGELSEQARQGILDPALASVRARFG